MPGEWDDKAVNADVCRLLREGEVSARQPYAGLIKALPDTLKPDESQTSLYRSIVEEVLKLALRIDAPDCQVSDQYLRAARVCLGWTPRTYEEIYDIVHASTEYNGEGWKRGTKKTDTEAGKERERQRLLSYMTVRFILAAYELDDARKTKKTFEKNHLTPTVDSVTARIRDVLNSEEKCRQIATDLRIARSSRVSIVTSNPSTGTQQERDTSSSSVAEPAAAILPKLLSAHWVVEQIRRYRARYQQFEENLDPVERTLVKLMKMGLILTTIPLLVAYFTSKLLAFLTEEFIPVPSIEPLRTVFEFLYDFDPIVFAIFVTVSVVVLLSQLAKISRFAKGFYHVIAIWLTVATVLAVLGLVLFDQVSRNSVASEKEEFSGALNEMRFMDADDVEWFVDSSRCDDMRRENVAGLRQCDVADGALRLAANRDQDIEVVTYPRGNLREKLQDLSGDFFASTRLRPADGTELSDCALLISEPSRNYEGYFHLIYRPEDRYPGYGAEFASRAELLRTRIDANGRREIYVASQTTLPYIGIINAHENEDGWVDLAVARRGTKYQLFVNERLIGEYVGAVATAANVYLAAINGGSNTGGTVNCHFGHLEIYARPQP